MVKQVKISCYFTNEQFEQLKRLGKDTSITRSINNILKEAIANDNKNTKVKN